MPIPVNLPAPPVRTKGTLTSVASRIPDGAYGALRGESRWPMEGVTWNPTMFTLPEAEESQCATVYNKVPSDILGPVEQPAFLLWRSLQCNALSGVRDLLNDRINYSLNDLVSAALAAELESGAASGGLALIGNTDYEPEILSAANEGVAASFAALEQYLADNLHGALGTIHVSAAVYVLATAAGVVRSDGNTATGHKVVGDAGHSGQLAPFGESVAGEFESWAYATSTVWYDLTTTTAMESSYDGASQFDFTRNVDRPLSERHGIVLFDPHVLAAVLVDTSTAATGGDQIGDDDDFGGAP